MCMDYRLTSGNGKTEEEKYHFTVSYVDGCYGSWSITMPSGKLRIGDKLYLSIPNGWDERLVYYPWYCGHIYWQQNQYTVPGDNAPDNTHPGPTGSGAQWNDDYYKYYHGNENNLIAEKKQNQFPYKLFVDFGNYESQSVYPAKIFTTSEVNLLLKLKIISGGGQVTFSLKVVDDSAKVLVNFGDGSTGFLSANNSTTHNYSSGTYDVKFYLVNGYYDTNSPIFIADKNSPIVSGGSVILNELFINPKFFEACSDIDAIVSHNNVSRVQYIKYYRQEDITEYKYLKISNSSIANLYVYNECDDYIKFVLEGSADIDNLYISSEILSIDFSAGDTTSILASNGCNIYAYALKPFEIISKKIDGSFAFNVSGRSVNFGSNVIFHVNSSLLAVMQSKYPLLNFVTI